MADIFISEYHNYPLVSVYIDDKLSFLSLVRESDLGSVYLCRVDNILDNSNIIIQLSGIRINPKSDTSYSLSDPIAAPCKFSTDDVYVSSRGGGKDGQYALLAFLHGGDSVRFPCGV